MATRTYNIVSSHNGRETIWVGTLDYLIDHVFGYTIECGHSHNKRIPLRPKTSAGLVNALNNSASACNRWSDDYYSLTNKELEAAKEKGARIEYQF